MGIEVNDYVFFDGEYFEDMRLLEMAKHAGSYQIAEHYLCPLLFYAIKHKKYYLAEEVNNVRRFYALAPFPTINGSPASENNMPDFVSKKRTANELAREKYKKMNIEQKYEVVKKSLILIMLNNPDLFNKRSCWIGIYLVINDRLTSMSQTDFIGFATKVTPSEWPDDKRIGNSTFSNVGRYLSFEDRQEAYYDMDNNPFNDLCERFWSVLRNEILTAN